MHGVLSGGSGWIKVFKIKSKIKSKINNKIVSGFILILVADAKRAAI